MAIATVHYKYFQILKEKNLLPHADSILEIGEQNWYGDLDPRVLFQDVVKYSPEYRKASIQENIKNILSDRQGFQLFEIAKVFYKIYFNTTKIRSIDLHGTKSAERLDLNLPHDLGEQFDAIFNLGTTEHVFNVYQTFKSMHDWLKVGGRMYHCLPMHGEIDHGFYNFNPTLFWDLAHANEYKIIAMAKATMKSLDFVKDRPSLSKNILSQDNNKNYGLIVTFEKTVQNPFKIPQQGRYDDHHSDQEKIISEWVRQRRITDEA